jgi:hypothetical protein
VTGDAIHFGAVNMGRMRKKDAIRLPGVDQPGHFAVFEPRIPHKKWLRSRLRPCISSWQSDALRQARGARKGPVFTEEVAALTALVHQLQMQPVIEIERLILLAVENLRKNDPSDDHAQSDPEDEKKDNVGDAVTGYPVRMDGYGLLVVGDHRCCSWTLRYLFGISSL